MRVHRAMRSLLSRATQADTSFNIGLGLIVILAVAEIFAATFYYIGRARAARASAQAIAATLVRPAAPAVFHNERACASAARSVARGGGSNSSPFTG